VYEKFAPHLANVVVEEMPEREAIPEVQPVEADTKEETLVSTPVTELSEEVAAESPAELPEVIKAPKVELKGLTVLGKIDLPTPKPKENAPAATVTEPSAEPLTEKPVESPVGKQNRPQRGEKPRESQRQERPRKNPVALNREREAKEAEERRKAEAIKLKEKKTLYYQNRVKPSVPTKAVRLIDEPLVHADENTMKKDPPKTWIGKFLRWLTT
jgi:hypothetical protein